MPSNLLTCHFRTVFEDVLTPFQQLQAINSLKDYVLELQHGTDEQRRELDVIGDDDIDSDLVNRKVNAALERCYWQLVMFLRSSQPPRISEAEPYLRLLLKSPTVTNDPSNFHRINATLHLAAAVASSALTRERFSSYRSSNTLSRLDEAFSLFSSGFSLYDTPGSMCPSNSPSVVASSSLGLRRRCLPPKTELWARASYIQLLRRLSHNDEASRQLELIKLFITSHPYALPADKYCAFVRELSLEFGLELEVGDDDPIRLVDAADCMPIITYDSELTSPASPTLSFPSSASTCSDSSVSSSPITPISLLPPATYPFSKDVPGDVHLEVPHLVAHP